LLSFAEPLIAWVDARSKRHGGDGATVTEAELSDSTQPAHAFVSVSIPNSEEPRTKWLLAEAHWAESFPLPSANSVAWWGAKFSLRAIWRVLTHLFRSFLHGLLVLKMTAREYVAVARGRSTKFELSNQGLRRVGSLTGFVVLLFIWTITTILGFFALLLSIPLGLTTVPLILTLGVAAAIVLPVAARIPGLKNYAQPAILTLAATVGDSFALRKLPISAAAMRSEIAQEIEFVGARARKLIVVGHSQGAALAVLTLREYDDIEVAELVTVGAGVQLLGVDNYLPVSEFMMGRPELRWSNLWTNWDPVPSGPIGDDDASASRRMEEMLACETTHVVDATLDNRISRALGIVRRADSDDTQPAQGLPKAAVPTSSLTVHRDDRALHVEDGYVQFNVVGPEEHAVHNRASLTRDHTTYNRSPQVLRHLVDVAMRVTGQSENWQERRDPLEAERKNRRYVTSVRFLAAARLICAVAAVLAACAYTKAEAVTPLFDLVERALALVGINEGVSSDSSLQVAIATVACFAISYGLVLLAWSRWREREFLRVNLGRDRWATFWRALTFVIATLVAIAAGVSVYELCGERSAVLPPEIWGVLAVLGLLLLAAFSKDGLRPHPIPQRRP
jgi:pimeloyl-ACP methyl ester carboxylesterase